MHAVARHRGLRLVGEQDDRLVGAAHAAGEMPIGRRHPGARVDHEQDRVAIGERGFGLRAHPPGERGGVALLQAGGVDDREFEIAERASPSRRSRVTPGVSSTSASLRPTSRLNSVDLPTLGRPMMATLALSATDSGVIWAPALEATRPSSDSAFCRSAAGASGSATTRSSHLPARVVVLRLERDRRRASAARCCERRRSASASVSSRLWRRRPRPRRDARAPRAARGVPETTDRARHRWRARHRPRAPAFGSVLAVSAAVDEARQRADSRRGASAAIFAERRLRFVGLAVARRVQRLLKCRARRLRRLRRAVIVEAVAASRQHDDDRDSEDDDSDISSRIRPPCRADVFVDFLKISLIESLVKLSPDAGRRIRARPLARRDRESEDEARKWV